MTVILDNLPAFVGGVLMTLRLLAVSAVGALVLGSLVAAARISPIAPVRGAATVLSEIVRNTPLTLVLFFCAFVLPAMGVRFDFVTFATIGLTIYTAPFVAEAIRSGINGIPAGQSEAARALGMRFGQVARFVVLPQAMRMVVPPLVTVIIALTKNTSVAAGFSVIELVAVSRQVIQLNGNATIAVLVAVAVLYLAITVPLGRLASVLERRVSVSR